MTTSGTELTERQVLVLQAVADFEMTNKRSPDDVDLIDEIWMHLPPAKGPAPQSAVDVPTQRISPTLGTLYMKGLLDKIPTYSTYHRWCLSHKGRELMGLEASN